MMISLANFYTVSYTLRKAALLLLCLSVFSLILGIMPALGYAETLSVQLLSAKLRNAPRQFAPSVADLQFGDSVTVKSYQEGWYQVVTPQGKEGYVHQTALTTKEIVLTSRQVTLADVAVDEAQVYLAGKGFNQGVENTYAQQDITTDYAAIAKMKKADQVPYQKSASFIRTGQLEEEGL